jgi:WD40 repeat protein
MKLTKVKDVSLPTGVLGLAITADGNKLYAACMDGALYECDPSAGKVAAFDARHGSFASGCVLLPDGRTLITAGYDGWLLWHEVNSKQCFRRVQAHTFWSWQLALSADGRQVATVTGQYLAGSEKYEPAPSSESTVKIFDTQSGDLVHSLDHIPPVLCTAFSADGKYLAAANMMGEVRVWDVTTGLLGAKFATSDFTSWGIIKSPHYCGGIYGLAFASDSASLLCCGMGPMGDPMAGNGKMTWQRWDFLATEPKKTGQIRDGDGGAGLMETLLPASGDNFLMAGRQAQGTWNAALFANDGKLLGSLDTKSRVTRAAFNADGGTLYLAATIGQPHRTSGGTWPDYGRIHVVSVGD